MALESFNAYHSYKKALEPLTYEERGRLFTALLEYSATGQMIELSGNERFVWGLMQEQIDRDKAAYEKKCAKNRENGAKSGQANGSERPRTVANAPERPRTGANEKPEQRTGAKDKDYNKDKDKDKDRDNGGINIPPMEAAAGDDDLAAVFQAWDKASGRIISLAEQEELVALWGEYGKEPMLSAIRQCTLNGVVKLSYLSAVLRGPREPTKKAEIDEKWL